MQYYDALFSMLKRDCTDSEFQWFNNVLTQGISEKKLGFVMAHRYISHLPLTSGVIQLENLDYPIDFSQWSRDQLVRTILLLSMDNGHQEEFHKTIEQLFSTADNRESQAIYSSIPFFNYAESWLHRAAEAIRSNVGLIFKAMAFNNPYPAMFFSDSAWNQLVLKTIFTNESIWKIQGLEERKNEALATTISDFAHERWAAGRSLPPEVWYLTSNYPGERFWQDAYKLLTSDNPQNRKAGYLLWKEQASQAPENFTETFTTLFDEFAQDEVKWRKLDYNPTP